MENGNRQPSAPENQAAPTVNNYRVLVIPPRPYQVSVYIPVHEQVAPQGQQVMRFQLPENENQDPSGMLRPPMVNALPVVHGPGHSWPFVAGPGIGQGQSINHAHLPSVAPFFTGRVTPGDVRYLNLDSTIALIPGRRLPGHGPTLHLIHHYRLQWLMDYQGVMNQINHLEQRLAALKTRETCLFAPVTTMLVQQFNALNPNQKMVNADVYQAFYNSLQNRIHNSGASDIVGLHVQCIKTSLNCMRNYLIPGNAMAPPPPGAGVWVPENPPGPNHRR